MAWKQSTRKAHTWVSQRCRPLFATTTCHSNKCCKRWRTNSANARAKRGRTTNLDGCCWPDIFFLNFYRSFFKRPRPLSANAAVVLEPIQGSFVIGRRHCQFDSCQMDTVVSIEVGVGFWQLSMWREKKVKVYLLWNETILRCVRDFRVIVSWKVLCCSHCTYSFFL